VVLILRNQATLSSGSTPTYAGYSPGPRKAVDQSPLFECIPSHIRQKDDDVMLSAKLKAAEESGGVHPMNPHDEGLLDPADYGLCMGPIDQYVAELLRIDPELRKVRNDFLRNLSRTMVAIRRSVENADYRAVQEVVHVLRGSAGNYGFIDLYAWATALEEELLGQLRSNVIDDLLIRSKAFAERYDSRRYKRSDQVGADEET
jgi:HPt (histidine-containing phosphotransfer) domain-containing protein